MDEYAEYIYKRKPHYRDIDPGDLTKQKLLREKLQCKPFKWFMETVAFDLPLKYPPIEPDDFGYGEVNLESSSITNIFAITIKIYLIHNQCGSLQTTLNVCTCF